MHEGLGFLLVVIAAFTQGTFAIFFKHMSPLKWENFWGLYSIIALILGPVIFASILIPDFFYVLSLIPLSLMILPMVFGAIWGIGNILFGISVVRIGLAITYTIVLGLATFLGTIIPIFISHTELNAQAFIYLVLGLMVTLSGIILSGYAGTLKDGVGKFNKSLKVGLILAIISGITCSMLNVGFVNGGEITKIAQNSGVSATNASALVWVIVLFAGFLINIGYVIYLFIKNKTFSYYKKITSKIFLAIIASGVLWYSSFALFGLAANILGTIGPSVGWAMLIALSVVMSNVWSIKFGEWKNSKKGLKIQLQSLGLIIIGTVLIAASALQ